MARSCLSVINVIVNFSWHERGATYETTRQDSDCDWYFVWNWICNRGTVYGRRGSRARRGLRTPSVVPVLRQRGGGVILNTASTMAIRPRAANTWYGASKAAVVAPTQSMALELAQNKIRVYALCPTIADTPLLAEALGAYREQAIEQMIKQVPLGPFCTPEDMANAALFLTSEEASFLTGVCLEVDGGRCF